MNDTLILSTNTPVVEFFGENNFMRVTFNPSLVTLERDVRHMAMLGFTIPSNIKDIVNNASKFMEHARSLQQAIAFYIILLNKYSFKIRILTLYFSKRLLHFIILRVRE